MINFTPELIQETANNPTQNGVIVCLSGIIGAALKTGEDSPMWEDYQDEYYSLCNGPAEYPSWEDYKEENEGEYEDEDEYNEAIKGGEVEPESYREIFEYWSVDSMLASDLESLGEIVIEWHGHHVWGRTTTGQSIAYDYAMHQVAENWLERHHA